MVWLQGDECILSSLGIVINYMRICFHSSRFWECLKGARSQLINNPQVVLNYITQQDIIFSCF